MNPCIRKEEIELFGVELSKQLVNGEGSEAPPSEVWWQNFQTKKKIIL